MTQADGERVGGAYVELGVKDDKSHEKIVASTDKTFKEVEKNAKKTADSIAHDFKKAGDSVSDSLEKALQPRGANGRFISIKKAGQEAFQAIGNAAETATSGLDSLQKALKSIFGGVGQLAASGPAGIAILASAFVLLAGAAAIAARAVQDILSVTYLVAAALPGLITGLVASFFILKAATRGVGDAFTELTEKQNKAGSAGVSNARQVADAQRGVLQAQKDLIKAKDDEIKRIRQLALEVQRARVTEARAADDVLKAEYALQRARDVGTPRSQIEAQLALDEANATLAESKQKTKDLAAEKAKADKNGVNGSEQVLRAQEQLRDAQDRLAQSQQKVSAGLASQTTAFDKLTKSAQAFVLALVSAKNQLAPIQDALQEAFFSGTAPLLQPIIDNIKELQPELTAVASAFGGIFKEFLKFFGTPEAKEGLRSLLTGISDALIAITPSIGPLLEAFTGLVGDSGEFGKNLGGKVAEALDGIAKFVREVDIEQLFRDAKDAIKELKPIVRDLASAFSSMFKILAFFGEYVLPSFVLGLRVVEEVLDFISDFLTGFKDSVVSILKTLATKLGQFVFQVESIPAKIVALGTKFFDAGKSVVTKLFAGISSAGGFVGDFAKNLTNTFVKFFNNTVIKSINNGIKAIQNGINSIPGLSLSLPQLSSIPALEKGGVSTKNTIAQISEGNKKEGILPLENSRAMRMVGEAIAKAGGTSAVAAAAGTGVTFGPGAFVLNFQGALPNETQARQIGTTIGRAAAQTVERRNIRSQIRSM